MASGKLINSTDRYGILSWILLDYYRLDAVAKNKLRVANAITKPCYTYDELEKYQNNCYLRNSLIGSAIGSTLYLLLVLFIILSETHGKFDVLRNNDLMPTYLGLLIVGVSASFMLRYVVASYLNAYIVFIFNCILLVLTVYGNHEYRCNKVSTPTPFSGFGQIPLFLMGSIERIYELPLDRMTAEIYDLRCDQSLVRLASVNLLGEVINVMITFRLVFV